MKYFKYVVLTIVVRLILLVFERLIGMQWDFHIDATFYVDQIESMGKVGVIDSILATGFENFLYILIGYIIKNLSLGLLDASTGLILFNISIAAITTFYILKFAEEEKINNFVAIFFIFSPYLAHLAINPLKDSLVIFLSFYFFFNASKEAWLKAIIAGILLSAARFHLGIITIAILIFAKIEFRYFNKKVYQTILFFLVSFLFFELTNNQLEERLDVEFEGRDFYPNGLQLVPDNLYIRFFFGWLFNFLVPYPFFPTRLADAGYFLHLAIYSFFIFKCIKKINTNFSEKFYPILLSSLFLLSFVLTTTPGAGPLVRYRLFPEMLLLISISGKKTRTRHE